MVIFRIPWGYSPSKWPFLTTPVRGRKPQLFPRTWIRRIRVVRLINLGDPNYPNYGPPSPGRWSVILTGGAWSFQPFFLSCNEWMLQRRDLMKKKHRVLNWLLSQWLTFWTFGDSIFSRENKVQTFFFRVHWLSEIGYTKLGGKIQEFSRWVTHKKPGCFGSWLWGIFYPIQRWWFCKKNAPVNSYMIFFIHMNLYGWMVL